MMYRNIKQRLMGFRSLNLEILESRDLLAAYTVFGRTDSGNTNIATSLSGVIKAINDAAVFTPNEVFNINFQLTDPPGTMTHITRAIDITGELPAITAPNVFINGIDASLVTSDKRII